MSAVASTSTLAPTTDEIEYAQLSNASTRLRNSLAQDDLVSLPADRVVACILWDSKGKVGKGEVAATTRAQRSSYNPNSVPRIDEVQHVSTGPFSPADAYQTPQNEAWVPFQMTDQFPLPDDLFGYGVDPEKSHVVLGLLPGINRAYAAVDNRLLLWDWADSSVISIYNELPESETIVGVGLVKPRPGVFVDTIFHLLVLSTTTQVLLVGIGFMTPTPGAKRELVFHQTNLSAPTDGVGFNIIRGTSDGQIFLAWMEMQSSATGTGTETVPLGGSFYSLSYQSDPGWFGKTCKISNLTSGAAIGKSILPSFMTSSDVKVGDGVIALEVDDERKLLYTLHQNNYVQMYRLPTASSSGGKLQSIKRTSFPIQTGGRVVSLQVVSVLEEGKDKVCLVVTNRTGRSPFLISPQSSSSLIIIIITTGMRTYLTIYGHPPLNPVAFRAPLAINPSAPSADVVAINTSISRAIYSPGGFLIATAAYSPDPNSTAVLLSAPIQPSSKSGLVLNQQGTSALRESIDILQVEGTAQAIEEVTELDGTGMMSRTELNELATPLNKMRRQWAVLTEHATYIFSRQRPVDTLLLILQAISMGGEPADADVRGLYQAYGRDEFCTMLLTVAALGDVSFPVAEQARMILLQASERPFVVSQGGFGSKICSLFQDLTFAAHADFLGRHSDESQAPTLADVRFSGRHEALVTCFARCIRPIWNAKITRTVSSPGSPPREESNVSREILSSVGNDLKRLRTFFEQSQGIFHVPNGGAQEAAYAAERESIASVQRLLVLADEAVSFILLLVDHNIESIISTCPPTVLASLQTLTYQSLINMPTGRAVATVLVRALIDQQIKRQLSIDAISDNLQRKCGSFCSPEDVLLYKAIQAMDRARTPIDEAERDGCLAESLRLFTMAAKFLTTESLTKYCREYNEMQFPNGAIELALACSREGDTVDRAMSYWLAGCPPNDPREKEFIRRVERCNLVIEALEMTDRILNSAAQKEPPRGSLTYNAADALRIEAYRRALSAKDEFFHLVVLYNWYMKAGRSDQLLQVRTPYLESYLQREPASAETITKWDLLWRYYVLTSRYPEAAGVLRDLADAPGLVLAQRVQYLSLAVGHAKAQYPSSGSDLMQQFVRDVENRLDVAQIQVEIHATISGSEASEERDFHLRRLDSDLFSVSDLWNDFAQPLKLQEPMLLILHVSDHRDTPLVLQLWREALAKARGDKLSENTLVSSVVSAKVTHLARRFHSSEISFPLFDILNMLEQDTFEEKYESGLRGWAPLALHQGGVTNEDLLDAFSALFLRVNSPPWQEPSGLVFLAQEFSTFAIRWYSAVKASPSFYSNGAAFPFKEVKAQLDECLRALEDVDQDTPGLRETVRTITDWLESAGKVRH
ncbi:hypothetical protein P7C70_g6820, partial [Phenoliferia sp. Uapishka_3]